MYWGWPTKSAVRRGRKGGSSSFLTRATIPEMRNCMPVFIKLTHLQGITVYILHTDLNVYISKYYKNQIEGSVAQLISAWSSELEFPSSVHGYSNVCFDFLRIRVVTALNTHKTEH